MLPTTALDICENCPDPRRFTSPGIGFDLTINYGTAAVSFPNGTTIPVSKIEGSPSYKYEMRRLLDESLCLYERPAQISSTPRQGRSKHSWATKKLEVLSQTLQYFHFISTPPKSPIKAMLQALKTSAESFLSQSIHSVEIAVSLNPPYNQDNQTHILDEMLYTLDLVRTIQRPTAANAAAGRRYAQQHSGVQGHLEYILAVEYSRAGLMLTVNEVDMTVSEERYRMWRGDLGSDVVREKDDYWRIVEGEIRRAVQQARGKNHIDYLLLIGDRVFAEPRLMDILVDVLGEDVYDEVRVKSGVGAMEIDPVFEAAFTMADMARENVGRAPEGCTYSGDCEGAERVRDEL